MAVFDGYKVVRQGMTKGAKLKMLALPNFFRGHKKTAEARKPGG
jgi:hypothetical protein